MQESTEIKTIDNFIKNKFVKPSLGNYHPVIDPKSSSQIAQVAISNKIDIKNGITSAEEALHDWSNVRTIKNRATLMERLLSIIEKHALELAKLIVLENGKNINEALAEVAKGNETMSYACSLPSIAQGNSLQVSTGGVTCTDIRDALGIVTCIVPFNFPYMVPMWTIPIALVLGNVVIVKPSEKVPMTLNRFAELVIEAGFPPGVFQIIHGTGPDTAPALMTDPSVKAVTFVGSSGVAKCVYSSCTSNQKRVLALGGAKNHLIALSDCDVNSASSDIVTSFAGCAGQRCMAASVLLLIGDNVTLLNEVLRKASEIKPGQEPGNMGPLIDTQAVTRVLKFITEAEASGKTQVLLDGRSWQSNTSTNWFGPTVLLHHDKNVPCMKEEIFGPVLSVYTCTSWEEAIAIQNSSSFGNACSIYTTVGSHADYFISKCKKKAAMIGINIGIPVPREPFSFGGLYGTCSKYGDMDITGDGAVEFFTERIKVTTRWPKIEFGQNGNAVESINAKDQASFVNQM